MRQKRKHVHGVRASSLCHATVLSISTPSLSSQSSVLCRLQGHSCGCPSNATSWTLHGLWYVSPRDSNCRGVMLWFLPCRPTYGETKGPCSCNSEATFNGDSIQVSFLYWADISEYDISLYARLHSQDLVSRLVMEWTNLMPQTSFYSFWYK